MKLSLKISSRDLSLLILVLAAVVFYVCYTFFITPSMEKAEIFKSEIQVIQDELDRAQMLSGKSDVLKKQEQQLREELMEKYSKFFYDLKQTRLLNKVDAMMIGAGLPPASYLASPEQASQVPIEKGSFMPQEYPLKDLAAKINPELQEASQDGKQGGGVEANPEAQQGVESTDMVPGTDVTVGFDAATYESIFNFIATVEKMNKTVVLKSIDISKEETGLAGQMIFSFYSLPKLDPEQKDGLEYTPAIPAGKTNPFS